MWNEYKNKSLRSVEESKQTKTILHRTVPKTKQNQQTWKKLPTE